MGVACNCHGVRLVRGGAQRRGSGLIDILAVVLVIGILLSLLVPMMLGAKDRSQRLRCVENLREIGWAMQRYAADHKGAFPMLPCSGGMLVYPDVGAGFARPAGASSPPLDNVPALLFLLARTQGLPGDRFICSATLQRPDDFDGLALNPRWNFRSIDRNLSYGIQNPYQGDREAGSRFEWSTRMPAAAPIVADRGAGLSAALSEAPASTGLQQENSLNHAGRGQNLLYADGSVDFVSTPLAGIQRDHIYRSRRGAVIDAPADRHDALLLPTD